MAILLAMSSIISTASTVGYNQLTSLITSVVIMFVASAITVLWQNKKYLHNLLRWKLTPLKLYIYKRIPSKYYILEKMEIFKFCNPFCYPRKREQNHFVTAKCYLKNFNDPELVSSSLDFTEVTHNDSDFDFGKGVKKYNITKMSFNVDGFIAQPKTINQIQEWIITQNKRETQFSKRLQFELSRAEKSYDFELNSIIKNPKIYSKQTRPTLIINSFGLEFSGLYIMFDEEFIVLCSKRSKFVEAICYKNGERLGGALMGNKLDDVSLRFNLLCLFSELRNSLIVEESEKYTHSKDILETLETVLTQELVIIRTYLSKRRGHIYTTGLNPEIKVTLEFF